MKFFVRFAFMWAAMIFFGLVAGFFNLLWPAPLWFRIAAFAAVPFGMAAFFLAYVDSRGSR